LILIPNAKFVPRRVTQFKKLLTSYPVLTKANSHIEIAAVCGDEDCARVTDVVTGL